MAKKLKIYNGSSWEDVTFAITPPATNVTNTFDTNQVIDTSTSVAALRVTQRGTGEAFRVEDSTNPDSSPFIINSSGNVGIGIVDPIAKVDILDEINSAFRITAYHPVDGAAMRGYGAKGNFTTPTAVTVGYNLMSLRAFGHNGISFGSLSAAIDLTASQTFTSTAQGSYIFFRTTADNTVGAIERMRIDQSGNVGIGPIVSGAFNKGLSINSESGQYAGIQLVNSSTGTATSDGSALYISNSSLILSNREAASLTFATSANERMTIDSTGYVGINTSVMGSRYLTVNGNTAIWGQMPLRLGEGSNTYYYDMGRDGSSGNFIINGNQTGSAAYVWQMGSVEKMRLDTSGQLNISNGKVLVNSTASVTGANWTDSMLHVTGDSTAANNPGMSWHAPGASAMAMWHPRGSQALQIMGNSGVVSTGSGTMTIRNIAISTSTPTGGADGDVWLTYTA